MAQRPRAERMAVTPPKPKPIPPHFVELATEWDLAESKRADDLLMHVFWKIRHQFPEMGMVIEQRDLDHVQAALEYNKQVPAFKVQPIHSGIAIRMVDVATGDMIIPQESLQGELDKAMAQKKIEALRAAAPTLVQELKQDLASGVLSNQSVNAVCDALIALALAR